jgi:hypothetical protein
MAEPRNPLTGQIYKVTVDVSGEREKSYDPNIPDIPIQRKVMKGGSHFVRTKLLLALSSGGAHGPTG